MMGVPRGFYTNWLHRYVPGEFRYTLGANDVLPNDPWPLREGQPEVVQGCIDEMKRMEFGGAIAEVPTGGGKTTIGCEISRRLGVKTLIITHTTVLRDQWVVDGINKFLPNSRVGFIQADNYDVKDKDVVIGMLQSLALKDDYPPELYEEFGLIITDEVHLTGAAEFSRALPRFGARWLLGLSGTLQRKDRAENVFKYNIGGVVSGMSQVKIMEPHVYFVDTRYTWFGGNRGLDRQKNGFLKSIVDSDVRNEIIVRQAVKAAESGRQVLVLSERVEHVKQLSAMIYQRLSPKGISVGIMVGASTKAERDAGAKSQVICATVQLIGTGFNEPRLDTLIFATPIQDVTQPVGRILRVVEGKKQPLVLDLVDSRSEYGLIMGNARRKRYKAKGWKIFGDDVFPSEMLRKD